MRAWAPAPMLAVFGLFLLLPAALPALGYTYLGTEVMIWAIFALGYNLLLGYTGLPAFGHGAFFGVGGYLLGMSQHWWTGGLWLPLLVGAAGTMLLGGLVGLVAGSHHGQELVEGEPRRPAVLVGCEVPGGERAEGDAARQVALRVELRRLALVGVASRRVGRAAVAVGADGLRVHDVAAQADELAPRSSELERHRRDLEAPADARVVAAAPAFAVSIAIALVAPGGLRGVLNDVSV